MAACLHVFTGRYRGLGSGIHNRGSSPELTNVTLSGNRSTSNPSTILNTAGSNPVIRNSIAWQNAGFPVFNDSGSAPVISFSLFEYCGPSSFWDINCGTDGGGNIELSDPSDPVFVAPIDPATAPSSLGSFYLALNSGAIDQGNNSLNDHPTDLSDVHPRITDGDGSGTATIDMGAYEAPVEGRLVIDKITLPAGSPQGFFFELTGAASTPVTFALLDSSPPFDSGNLTPGTYSVVEMADPEWDLETAICSDGSLPTAVDLLAGETVTCVFQNIQRAHTLADVVTQPAASPHSFEFLLSGGPDGFSQVFSLTDLDPPYYSPPVRPGSYSLNVSADPEWDLESALCDDGTDPTASTIDMLPGDNVFCTYHMTERVHILVDVVTVPGGSPHSFEFQLSGGPDGFDQFFYLTDADPLYNSPPVRHGSYSLDVTAEAQWELVSASCDNGTDPTTSTINMLPGDKVLCTYNMRELIFTKVPVPAASGLSLLILTLLLCGAGFVSLRRLQ